jgi:hypothetical protein
VSAIAIPTKRNAICANHGAIPKQGHPAFAFIDLYGIGLLFGGSRLRWFARTNARHYLCIAKQSNCDDNDSEEDFLDHIVRLFLLCGLFKTVFPDVF